MKRAPFDGGTEIEVRQVFEEDDFGEEFTPELREQEQRHPRPGRAERRLGRTRPDPVKRI